MTAEIYQLFLDEKFNPKDYNNQQSSQYKIRFQEFGIIHFQHLAPTPCHEEGQWKGVVQGRGKTTKEAASNAIETIISLAVDKCLLDVPVGLIKLANEIVEDLPESTFSLENYIAKMIYDTQYWNLNKSNEVNLNKSNEVNLNESDEVSLNDDRKFLIKKHDAYARLYDILVYVWFNY